MWRQDEGRWNIGDDRHGVGHFGHEPDQQRAQRSVRRSRRLRRHTRRPAGGDEKSEEVVSRDELRVCKPRKHGSKKRMVEHSARQPAGRGPANARSKRARERRIGERVQIKRRGRSR